MRWFFASAWLLLMIGACLASPARAAGASITANPADVLAPAGGTGTTTITWSTGDGSAGQVDVSCDGGPKKLFAAGASGTEKAPWIGAGSTCTFVLLGGPGYSTTLASTTVTGVQAGTVTANPTRLTLPSGGLGSVTVSWWTADGSDAEVWVSVNGGPQKLMAHSASGTATPNWIGPGSTVFSLYAGTSHSQLLDAVTVTASAQAPGTPTTTTVAPVAPRTRRVRARLVFTWTWNGQRTTLHRFTMSSVPRRATVTVACRGPGCFRHRRTAGHRRLHKLLASLRGSVFRPGDRLLITVTAPGMTAERAEVKIRRHGLPVGRLL